MAQPIPASAAPAAGSAASGAAASGAAASGAAASGAAASGAAASGAAASGAAASGAAASGASGAAGSAADAAAAFNAPITDDEGKNIERFEVATLLVGNKRFPVQFNPSEYTISRGVKLDKKMAPGEESSGEIGQPIHGEPSVLDVTLYFDCYTDLDSYTFKDAWKIVKDLGGSIFGSGENKGERFQKSLGSALKPFVPQGHPAVNERVKEISMLVRSIAAQHRPPLVGFGWGKMLFRGTVQSSVANYTMFAPDGTPMRVRMTLKIVGEEQDLDELNRIKPKESPDRTKERLMPYGDQLWMLAQDEYGDPGEWKTIARANNILNPRKIDRAVRLKLPSQR